MKQDEPHWIGRDGQEKRPCPCRELNPDRLFTWAEMFRCGSN